MSPAPELHGDCQQIARGAPLQEKTPFNGPLLQIAPMMEVTYKDFRQFMRLLTRRSQLWTEMIVDSTLRFTQKEERPLGAWLDFGTNEHPIVCQLGGSDPSSLAEASQIVERWGYDEINLNCGCPSDRVSGKGEFGASLMKRPELVRDCVRAMSRAVQIPVTVKTRLGVDDLDSPEFSAEFVNTVAQAGCKHFIIHARKAWLQGLSPAQNRSIPPLMYDRVVRLCHEFPHLSFSLNGGVTSLEHVKGILAKAPPNLAGVMLGRAAHDNPCLLWDVDRAIYGETPQGESTQTRRSLAEAYAAYLEEEHPPDEAVVDRSGPTHFAIKPVLGLLAGCPGNRLFRRTLDTTMRDKHIRAKGPAEVLRMALGIVSEQHADVLDSPLLPSGPSSALDQWLAPIVPTAVEDPPEGAHVERSSEAQGEHKGKEDNETQHVHVQCVGE